MSQIVPQTLPPVPQVALRLYGNQAIYISFRNHNEIAPTQASAVNFQSKSYGAL